MASSMNLLFIFISVAAFTAITNALYCRHYIGDISFSYATTEDEDYWFTNYKNAYVGKKGGEPYAVYRRRTTITRHRGSRPRPIFNNMNSLNNDINQIQQVQQVQQVQQMVPPFQVEFNTHSGEKMNETDEDLEEKKALPIWKITIPRQIKKALVARVEDGKIIDHFELNETHFDNPNITTSSSSSLRLTSALAQSTSTRTIDITDQSMVPDSWYAICVQVNVMQKGAADNCDQCTLLKARIDGGRQYFLDYDWVAEMTTNTTAELRFLSTDFPFKSASVKTKVVTKYQYPRCHTKNEHVVFDSKDTILPEYIMYLDVNGLQGKVPYGVQVDVDFQWKEKSQGILPTPFVLLDYLHNDQSTLAKCDDYTYQGD